jgi:S1-C subfamily serine protease
MNVFLQLSTFARLTAGAIALGGALLMPSAWAQTTTQTAAENSGVANAVVKVFTTSRNPDPFKPWAKQSPSESTGTGVLIDGNRILTNAHVVRYASQVQVQPNQSGEKFAATVVAIAQGIDLAILKLDDDSVFRGKAPLQRANVMPEIKDAVLAYGFPTGGTSLSITKGIVSRIEFAGYNAPVSGLRIQIDAAINPGNSGGPAVAGDKMIGLAFSTLTNAQNIGYIIPNEEIELFLKDVADGRYDGKPTMHDELQTLENPALRTFLKLDKAVKGIVVHRPYSTDAAYPLKKWDVITHVDGTPVDDQGMVKAGPELRLNLRYLIQKQAKNGIVPLTVVRDSKPLQINLPVSAERPMLIPDLKGDYPSYFVYGPMVFSKATAQFNAFLFNSVGTIAGFSFVKSPLVLRRGDEPDAQNDELVVISSPFFTHKLSVGYSNPALQVVEFVNGTRIKSLGQLVALLRDVKSEFVTIETANRGGETLVFPHKDMVAAVEDILNDNGVRVQGTPDTMAIWKGAAKP